MEFEFYDFKEYGITANKLSAWCKQVGWLCRLRQITAKRQVKIATTHSVKPFKSLTLCLNKVVMQQANLGKRVTDERAIQSYFNFWYMCTLLILYRMTN
jgi:hypothetical protein